MLLWFSVPDTVPYSTSRGNGSNWNKSPLRLPTSHSLTCCSFGDLSYIKPNVFSFWVNLFRKSSCVESWKNCYSGSFKLCFSFSRINAIKEITARCPLAMTEELLQDLAQYKTHKDKSKLHVTLYTPKSTVWLLFTSLYSMGQNF